MAEAYGEFLSDVSTSDLQSLSALATELFKAESEVSRAEEALEKAKNNVRELAERSIPELMAKVGLTDLRTSSGLRLRIKKDVFASITKANNYEAIKWLDAHGHGGLVKRKIIVEFPRTDVAKAIAAAASLRKKFENVSEENSVHSMTLRAWARGQLEEGSDVPHGLFGIVPFSIAVLDTKSADMSGADMSARASGALPAEAT